MAEDENDSDDTLTPRERRFVGAYLISLNATQAAIDAGYTQNRRSASVRGAMLAKRPDVAAAIQEALEYRRIRTGISQDRVLEELARVAFFDLGKCFDDRGALKSIHAIDEDTRRALSQFEVEMHEGHGENAVPCWTTKVKGSDKLKALELCGRHLGMWKDTLKHEVGKSFAELVLESFKAGRE